MYLPFEVACVLVRDAEAHRSTFAAQASYLGQADRGVLAGGLPFADRGIELTRNFKALKVWMSLKAYGVNSFARLIEQNVRQAQYLAKLVETHPDIELMASVPLNVVCFRYAPKDVPADQLNSVNQEILVRLQESGIAVPSSTWLGNQFAIRAAIVNHRSKTEDFDILVSAVANIGQEVVAHKLHIVQVVRNPQINLSAGIWDWRAMGITRHPSGVETADRVAAQGMG